MPVYDKELLLQDLKSTVIVWKEVADHYLKEGGESSMSKYAVTLNRVMELEHIIEEHSEQG